MKTLPIEFVNRNGLTLARDRDDAGWRGTFSNGDQSSRIRRDESRLQRTPYNKARALAEEGIAASVLIFPITARATENLKERRSRLILNDTEICGTWAKTQDFVDPEKMILSGHSMGGL